MEAVEAAEVSEDVAEDQTSQDLDCFLWAAFARDNLLERSIRVP